MTGAFDQEPWEHESIPASIDARRIYEYAIEIGGSRRRRREQRRRAIVAGVSCALALVVAVGIFASQTNPNDAVTVAQKPTPRPARRPHAPPLDHTTTPARAAVACELIVFHEKRPPNVGKPPKTTTTTSPPPPTTAAPVTTTSPPTTLPRATTTPPTTAAPKTTVPANSPTTAPRGPKPTVVVKGTSQHPKHPKPVVRRRPPVRGTRGVGGAGSVRVRPRKTPRCR